MTSTASNEVQQYSLMEMTWCADVKEWHETYLDMSVKTACVPQKLQNTKHRPHCSS